MCKLRSIMIHSIKHYGWLDYVYIRDGGRPHDKEGYEIYLYGLTDDDFLYHYNDVHKAIDNLD